MLGRRNVGARHRGKEGGEAGGSLGSSNGTTRVNPIGKGHRSVTNRKLPVIGFCLFVGLVIFVLRPTGSKSSESDLRDLRGYSYGSSTTSKSISEAVVSDTDSDSSFHVKEYSVNAVSAAKGKGSKDSPVLLKGWKSRPKKDSWSQEAFKSKFGNYPQYLKDIAVQPFTRKNDKDLCILPGSEIMAQMEKFDLLFFTNNLENGAFMKEIQMEYETPELVSHIKGFDVFSAMAIQKSHPFHKHGESWLGQVEGKRMWWFLPMDYSGPSPPKVNACQYLTGQAEPPKEAVSVVQYPGDVIWFPTDMYHATCSLDRWSVGVGAQSGKPIRQRFSKLDPKLTFTPQETQKLVQECLGNVVPTTTAASNTEDYVREMKSVNSAQQNSNSEQKSKEGEWLWFDGDLNAYYNSLETQDSKRNPNELSSYAVHRWMGPSRSTEEHYKLLDDAFFRHQTDKYNNDMRVLDGGCGLGSALMWMEGQHPKWKMTGHTISEEQHKFIVEKLPPHHFHVNLRSYDELDADAQYDVIYSIEALIHSYDIAKTVKEWASHLAPGGIMVLIDDFVSVGADKNSEEMQSFAKSWLANSLVTPSELGAIGRKVGLEVVENQDLDAKYRIIELNYRNKKPDVKPFGGRTHQGWMGSKWRQRLTVEGKLTYNLMIFQKKGGSNSASALRQLVSVPATNSVAALTNLNDCTTVPVKSDSQAPANYTFITPQLMSGTGNNGGKPMTCISGWYCCNKGVEWHDHLTAKRTDDTAFLKLDRDLFGHYMDSFTKYLNEHYSTYPAGTSGGRFLDIGGTGSTASGMTQVTSKFQHFAGPLEYWKLDSDSAAKSLERTIHCDIDECPQAEDCTFDVTFSHTVLEHANRPWKSFETVSRITKKGGLTLHLVPFSYQYHATPEDNYRFSHTAVKILLEDNGFDVLDVGYDICNKQDHMKNRIDEHYDIIWLTYVVGRKR